MVFISPLMMEFTLEIGKAVGAPGGPDAGLGKLLTTILTAAMIMGALMVLLYLIWGGLDWITSHSEKSKIEQARQKITGAIIGLIILASSLALFSFIQDLFHIKVINIKGTSSGSSGGGGSGGGGSGGGGGSSGGGSSGTCAPSGELVSDGGAGGYCSEGGTAMVRCVTGDVVPGIPYPHYEPCSCKNGEPLFQFQYCR